MKIKSGLLTTEFYVTLILSVTGMLVFLGVITPEQANLLNTQFKVLIDGIAMTLGALMTIIPVVVYILSRTNLKKSFFDMLTFEGNSLSELNKATGKTDKAPGNFNTVIPS